MVTCLFFLCTVFFFFFYLSRRLGSVCLGYMPGFQFGERVVDSVGETVIQVKPVWLWSVVMLLENYISYMEPWLKEFGE